MSFLFDTLFGLKPGENKQADDEKKYEEPVDYVDLSQYKSNEKIRIAVLGATGTGKSTLCNLLCDDELFEANDDDDSCTQQTKSESFNYIIAGQRIQFEVIDCPGFFDTNVVLSKINKVEAFAQDIKKCCDLTQDGISAFLFCVPVGRLTTDFQNSIKFMRDYFDQDASKHVIYTFTKCDNTTAKEIINRKKVKKQAGNQKEMASKLSLKYLEMIDYRCVATECKYARKNINYRENVLRIALQTHINNGGATYGNVMWKAFQKQRAQYRKERRIRIAVASVAVSTASAAMYLTKLYFALTVEKVQLQQQKGQLQQRLETHKYQFQQQKGQLQEQNEVLQQNVDKLQQLVSFKACAVTFWKELG